MSDPKAEATDNLIFYIMLVAIAVCLALVTWLTVAAKPECTASNYTYCGDVYYDFGHH